MCDYRKPPARGPQLNHWVWVTNYIDFDTDGSYGSDMGQMELCRVERGDNPNQLVLHGHWRGGNWEFTEVYLDLYPPIQKGRRKSDYIITKLGWQRPNVKIPVWLAEYRRPSTKHST